MMLRRLPTARRRVTWLLGANEARKGHRRQVGAAPRKTAFTDRAFVPICPIDRFIGISTCFPARPRPAWRRRGVSFAEARELEQRHQPPLPARVAVDIALRDLYRLVAGEQLNIAQAAAGLVRVSRRRRNEAAAP